MSAVALVTGFGAFPGAASNPTERLIETTPWPVIERRLGLEIVTAVLPVTYADLPGCHADLVDRLRPSIALHFGLAGRARVVRVERFAINHQSPIRPDAAGQVGAGPIDAKAEPRRRCTWPAEEIAAALDRAGTPAVVSHEAGDYLCNLLLWRTTATDAGRGGRAGFVHIPQAARLAAITGRSRRNALAGLAEPVLRVLARGL